MGARKKKGVQDPSTVAKEAPAAEASLSLTAVIGALAGLAAAWLAAGSIGVLAHPLRHALAWVALLVAALAVWPREGRGWKAWLLLAGGVVVAAVMMISSPAVYNVLAVALVLALLASMRSGLEGRVLLIVASAAGLLGLYRLALISIPAVWTLADALGYGLGRLAGALVERPLSIGATFGGLDLLVVMAALYAGWLIATPPPRLPRALYALAAIVVAHIAYLALLSYATDLRAALPPPPPPPESENYVPLPWSWSKAVASLLPWNLPLAGAVIHLIVAGLMLRWVAWLPVRQTAERASKPADMGRPALEFAPWVLAVLLPLIIAFSLGVSDLSGKRILVYNDGYLNWRKPVFEHYGQASAGAYGMLPTFVELLGGRLVRSDELSEAELAKADVLMLIHPLKPWPEAIDKRVWDYVRRGGSLLVVAEPRVLDGGQASAFDEVLAPTAMRVRFDTAIGTNYKWEQAIAPMIHPATTGVVDDRNRFGLLQGSSIELGWPARPILVGRWGWSDPGSDALMTQAFRYEPGEKLGDLVLAAEQRIGRGTVAVLADPYGLTNEGMAAAYEFTGRLLGYLAWRPANPQAGWRQLVGLAVGGLLVGLVIRRPAPTRLALVVVLLGGTLAMTVRIGAFQSRVLPDGSKGKPYNNLAYIDASHLERYNHLDWTFEDIVGLKLTLMRNGYLPLMLREMSAEALERAGMLISIAPGKEFSSSERQIVREFVEKGGIFICTAGAEHARPVQPLLAEFGFRVPLSPQPPGEPPETKPMGHIRVAYLNSDDYRADVLIYTGWPIEPPRDGLEKVVAGLDQAPVMACARAGRGKVFVVGDSAFALNKNLEYIGGEPFEGRYDNADFWRWLITFLNDQPIWHPPNALGAQAAGTEDRLDPVGAAAGGLRQLRLPGKPREEQSVER